MFKPTGRSSCTWASCPRTICMEDLSHSKEGSMSSFDLMKWNTIIIVQEDCKKENWSAWCSPGRSRQTSFESMATPSTISSNQVTSNDVHKSSCKRLQIWGRICWCSRWHVSQWLPSKQARPMSVSFEAVLHTRALSHNHPKWYSSDLTVQVVIDCSTNFTNIKGNLKDINHQPTYAQTFWAEAQQFWSFTSFVHICTMLSKLVEARQDLLTRQTNGIDWCTCLLFHLAWFGLCIKQCSTMAVWNFIVAKWIPSTSPLQKDICCFCLCTHAIKSHTTWHQSCHRQFVQDFG